MFDISEYYDSSDINIYSRPSIDELERDIADEVDTLLRERINTLYDIDVYKYDSRKIEIIYPSLSYSGNRSLMQGPNKMRSLLSFYPQKEDLGKISKIVLRPRYIEFNGTELVGIYIRKQRILILYITHPYLYDISDSKFERYSKFFSIDLIHVMNKKLSNHDKPINTIIKIPALWYCISVADNDGSGKMDKFLIKPNTSDSKTYSDLKDISEFYTRHGY